MEQLQDLTEANRCIRDLAAISLLPAIWSCGNNDQIRESLADSLKNSLGADLVYIQPAGSGTNGHGSLRPRGPACNGEVVQKLDSAIELALGKNGKNLAELNINGQKLHLLVLPLGPVREFGVIAVASSRQNFPSASERIILNVATNQAIIAFRSASQFTALRRSEGNLRDFFENATVGLHWVNAEGVIIWANRRELQMLGYTAEEYIGRHISDFHAETCVIEDILSRLTKGETLQSYEATLRCKDGSVRHVLIDSSVLFENGRFIHTRCFTRDVTEEKKAQEAVRRVQEQLRQHAEKLEKEVEDRTAELRETIQELEAFSYSVSHDMRSPLRAMQGYAEALLEEYNGRINATGMEYLQRIRRAAARMDMLIQDVLAYSRIAKGEITLKKVNLEEVIKDVLQNYPTLQKDHAQILVCTPFPPVMGHEAYLTQIFSNLLTNAVKFIAPGTSPLVKISAETEENFVKFCVEDNGIGIAPEHQKQIFEIFGRVYSEKKFEGTGIGLAIAKKAAERMGGSIKVDSDIGKGSRFFVILQRAE